MLETIRDFSEVFAKNIDFSSIRNYFRDSLPLECVIVKVYARGFACL